MAKQQIKRFKKFPEIPGMDKELDIIIRQILDQVGSSDAAYGELYSYADAAITVTISVASTYYQATGFQKGLGNKFELSTKDLRSKEAGYYAVNVAVSFTHDTNNTICHCSLFINDVENEKLETERKIGTAGDYGAMSFTGLIALKASDKIDVRFKADKTGTITINHINFNLVEIL